MRLESSAGVIIFTDADQGGRVIRPGYQPINRPSMKGHSAEMDIMQPSADDRSNWHWDAMPEAELLAIQSFKIATAAGITALYTPEGLQLVGVIIDLQSKENVDDNNNGLGTYDVGLGFNFDVGAIQPEIGTKLSYVDSPINFIELVGGGDLELENA